MKVPKTIKVFGHTFKIKYTTSEEQRGKGTYDSWYHVININSDIPENQQAEVLLHEILELLKCELDLRLPHNVLTAISTALFGCIRDNNLDFRNQNEQRIIRDRSTKRYPNWEREI